MWVVCFGWEGTRGIVLTWTRAVIQYNARPSVRPSGAEPPPKYPSSWSSCRDSSAVGKRSVYVYGNRLHTASHSSRTRKEHPLRQDIILCNIVGDKHNESLIQRLYFIRHLKTVLYGINLNLRLQWSTHIWEFSEIDPKRSDICKGALTNLFFRQ